LQVLPSGSVLGPDEFGLQRSIDGPLPQEAPVAPAPEMRIGTCALISLLAIFTVVADVPST